MRVIRTLFAALLLMSVVAGAGSSVTLAQTSADLTETEDFDFVSPEGCTPEPASLARVTEIAYASDATPVNPEELLIMFESDEPVTGEDADAVRALLHTMVSCINANNPMSFLSLFTDSFYKRYGPAVAGIVQDASAQAEDPDAERQPLDDGYAFVLESGVFALEDGRLIYSVAAAWVSPEPQETRPSPEDVMQIVAAEIDGVWLIDELRIGPYTGPGAETDVECGENCADLLPGTPVTGEGYSGWIMPAQTSQANAVWLMHVADEEVHGFLPYEEEIATAEAALPDYLATNDRATDNLRENLASYQRQYFGLTSESGRFLMINGFCDSFDIDPSTNVIMVEDGGDCFWFAVFNLDTEEFETLIVNGDA